LPELLGVRTREVQLSFGRRATFFVLDVWSHDFWLGKTG
jgi:hypothetical protein